MLDLHWQRENGFFGGMNVWGGPEQTVSGEGPYVFKFTPQPKPDLAYYIVTAYTTPTGDWKDHVDMAQWGVPAQAVAPAEGYRSPAIDKTNFLVEAYFRTEPGHTGGVLLQKKDRAGYALAVDSRGGLTFQVAGQSESAEVQSRGQAERWPMAPRDRRGRPQGQEAEAVCRWAPRRRGRGCRSGVDRQPGGSVRRRPSRRRMPGRNDRVHARSLGHLGRRRRRRSRSCTPGSFPARSWKTSSAGSPAADVMRCY